MRKHIPARSVRPKCVKTAIAHLFPVFFVVNNLVHRWDAGKGHKDDETIRKFHVHCLMVLSFPFVSDNHSLGPSVLIRQSLLLCISITIKQNSFECIGHGQQRTVLHRFSLLIINSISRMSSSESDPIKKMKNISIPFMRKSCHAFIKQVKDASSAEEERVLIANESSIIRSDFGQQKTTSLREDLTKLIFIYLLGYPAHFGQMACLQLISSPVFQDKRIGYLAMNLFIHESNDILLLTVNSIKNDIRSTNMCLLLLDDES